MTRVKTALSAAMLLGLFLASPARAEDAKPEEAKPAKAEPARAEPEKGEPKKLDRAALEKRFSERMANTVLVGRFTVDGQPDKPATEERYEIESVTKLRDDYWTFLARIKYGKNDLKVPVTVKVLWAGDTPMVSLTDLTIPGLGTFTSRVLFYEDRYAGTWQHGEVGGHMFGRIEKARPTEKPPEKE